MDRRLPGLAAALVLALVAVALPTASHVSVPSFVVRGSAINFNLSYSDPASDVAQLWTTNGTHVTDANGFWNMSPSPGEVNLIRLSSAYAGANVDLSLKVQTVIASRANVSYQIRMFTRADNRTHYLIDVSNGLAFLKQNKTGTAPVNVTANMTISPPSTLSVAVSKASMGGMANITAWNIDASSKEAAGVYTYDDFIWQQPGNPGSAPAFVQGRVTDAASGAGLSGANVSAGSTGFFTTTNATGYYSLPAAPGNLTLVFSHPGYDSVSKAVAVQYQQSQTVNAQLSKSQPSVLASPFLWAGLVVLAAAFVAVLVLMRRRKKASPPEKPPAA